MIAGLRILTLLCALLWVTGADAANRFLTCNTACTITAADTSIWGSSSGGTGASVPGSSDAVILDAATCVGGTTCTATVGAGYNPSWLTLTFGACTASTAGCILDFSVNNNNLTTLTLSGTGTGTRTLRCGTGTFNINPTAGGNAVDFTTTTNLTFTCGGATFAASSFSTASVTWVMGGLATWGNITIAAGTGGAPITLSTGATVTMASLTIAAPRFVFFTSGQTHNITTLTVSGSGASAVALGRSSSASSPTVAITAATIDHATFDGLTFTGSPVATNSFDHGGNSGVTINGPSGGGRCIGC